MRVPWPSDGLWRHPDFLRLWAAQAGSAFGSRISRTVLPIIAILTIGATPTQVAILSTLSFAPGVLVGLFAGGFIDRNRKRPLLIGEPRRRARRQMIAEGVGAIPSRPAEPLHRDRQAGRALG